MDCTSENFKTIAALVRQEATRLERMGMTPSEARKTSCLIVGASLTPAMGGADLNNWLCGQMRTFIPKVKENGTVELFTDDITSFGITVLDAEFPRQVRQGRQDDRRAAMRKTCEHLKPGDTIKLNSADKKLLVYLQQYMKHLSVQLRWGDGKPGSYRSTLQANSDGKTFDLYVQRLT